MDDIIARAAYLPRRVNPHEAARNPRLALGLRPNGWLSAQHQAEVDELTVSTSKLVAMHAKLAPYINAMDRAQADLHAQAARRLIQSFEVNAALQGQLDALQGQLDAKVRLREAGVAGHLFCKALRSHIRDIYFARLSARISAPRRLCHGPWPSFRSLI